MKILTVVGARPQFIKAAAVSQALDRAGLTEILVHTGQHFDADMSEVFFQELRIPEPAYNLAINGGRHGEMTGRMLAALEGVLLEERPDWLVVYGDTNSTLAAALAAAKLHIPIAHVEAGLRSFNRRMPEEINRVLTDHVSTLLLCPTRRAADNLAREGVVGRIETVGDVMHDMTLLVREHALRGSNVLERLGLKDGGYALATVHRAENTDGDGHLVEVLDWLRQRARDCPVVLPLHPRTRQRAAELNLSLDGLRVCPPVGYLDMNRLLAGAASVFTDSGGLQKEAYFHRKPCVTLRDETEWTETIEAGWNRLWKGPDYVTPARDIEEYGDGHTADRIAELLAALHPARCPS